jgi:hypothetical protein
LAYWLRSTALFAEHIRQLEYAVRIERVLSDQACESFFCLFRISAEQVEACLESRELNILLAVEVSAFGFECLRHAFGFVVVAGCHHGLESPQEPSDGCVVEGGGLSVSLECGSGQALVHVEIGDGDGHLVIGESELACAFERYEGIEWVSLFERGVCAEAPELRIVRLLAHHGFGEFGGVLSSSLCQDGFEQSAFVFLVIGLPHECLPVGCFGGQVLAAGHEAVGCELPGLSDVGAGFEEQASQFDKGFVPSLLRDKGACQAFPRTQKSGHALQRLAQGLDALCVFALAKQVRGQRKRERRAGLLGDSFPEEFHRLCRIGFRGCFRFVEQVCFFFVDRGFCGYGLDLPGAFVAAGLVCRVQGWRQT